MVIVTIGKQVPIPPPGSVLVTPPSATIVGCSVSYIYDVKAINAKNDQSEKNYRIKNAWHNVVSYFAHTSTYMTITPQTKNKIVQRR